MRGVVNFYGEAALRLTMRSSKKAYANFQHGHHRHSGYNGSLTMTRTMIEALGLQDIGESRAPNWRTVTSFHFRLTSESCNGMAGRGVVEVYESRESDPLIGMELLEGYELQDAREARWSGHY